MDMVKKDFLAYKFTVMYNRRVKELYSLGWNSSELDNVMSRYVDTKSEKLEDSILRSHLHTLRNNFGKGSSGTDYKFNSIRGYVNNCSYGEGVQIIEGLIDMLAV